MVFSNLLVPLKIIFCVSYGILLSLVVAYTIDIILRVLSDLLNDHFVVDIKVWLSFFFNLVLVIPVHVCKSVSWVELLRAVA